MVKRTDIFVTLDCGLGLLTITGLGWNNHLIILLLDSHKITPMRPEDLAIGVIFTF